MHLYLLWLSYSLKVLVGIKINPFHSFWSEAAVERILVHFHIYLLRLLFSFYIVLSNCEQSLYWGPWMSFRGWTVFGCVSILITVKEFNPLTDISAAAPGGDEGVLFLPTLPQSLDVDLLACF